MSQDPSRNLPPEAPQWYLLVTALISGAMVMVLEVLGSRVIGPFFGASLFVWTSLISVTLLALALGYAVGGWLIDRRESANLLYLTLGVAGCITLMIPLIKLQVIQWCLPLGLRAGSFASALILFGPPLFLLGCVSPQLAKVATRNLARLGRTVGGLYATSTIGSVGGTLITGFVLIELLSVDDIFRTVGVVLLALPIGYALFFRRNLASLGLVLIPLLVPRPDYIFAKTLESGVQVRLVDEVESFHGSLKVIDYRKGTVHLRELVIDGLIQGGVDLNNGLSVYEYPYVLEFLPFALHPKGQRALMVGLGAGLVPTWYERMGIRTDVVDIDPSVVELARRHFGLSLDGEVFVADARYFLATSGPTYDYILLDVFSGDITPGYLLSHEAVGLMHGRLTKDGIVAINLVLDLAPRTRSTQSILRTLRAHFDQVQIHPMFEYAEGLETLGNAVIVAYDGPARSADLDLLRHQPVHPMARRLVTQSIGTMLTLPPSGDAELLRDAHNPLDVTDTWIKEAVREDIVNSTDWDILGASL